MTSCGRIIGILLIAVPVIALQIDPETPLGISWEEGHYRTLCTVLGGIGGALMARREDNSVLGFLWAAGLCGGAVTTNLAYLASLGWLTTMGEASVNIFVLFLCAIPGLVVYGIVKRCSDYTFPNYNNSLVDNHVILDTSRSRPNSNTPLLAYKV
jgi:hypothetical protein